MTQSPGAPASTRALALDALRGLAMLAMLLSGQLPFGENALPSWMYHAQEPPPLHQWIGTLPGITWVDLVFPFFLFSMGAAFPLALTRRMERGDRPRKLAFFVLERGALLGFFALFVQAIRPGVMSEHPGPATQLLGLLGFVILFPILTRFPEAWPRPVKWGLRAAGWAGALAFFVLVKYPDGSGFSLDRGDIIIVVLANMAVFGAALWMLTRDRLLIRLGVIGILFAIRLSNMPEPTPGWVHDLWTFTPAPWIYKLYYLQYLCIVIPGTVAGDLILQWTRQRQEGVAAFSNARLATIALLMVAFVLDLLIGLKARWLLGATVLAFALCAVGWKLLARPGNSTERLYRDLFQWAVYWLILGLCFEPWEGGIKKDHPTLSYYFVCSGLAICVYIALSIIIDAFQKRRWLQLLVDNGQNPMIAYAGINNFIAPLLALTGAAAALDHFASTPWRGFWRGATITLLMALTGSFLTRRKIFWRT